MTEPAAILVLAASERFSAYDLAVVDEELRGALTGAADYRQQSRELLARDQAQRAAFGTGEHWPSRGSSFSPTRPAFSSTKMVPGSICSVDPLA